MSQQETKKRDTAITVSHITIRQSISFLLLKIISLDILAAFFSIIYFSYLYQANVSNPSIAEVLRSYNSLYFIALGFLKISFTIFVILQWLEEYYEITPKDITYRSGLIFKKEDKQMMQHVGAIKMDQGVFGRLLNYGTISIYNWEQEKYAELYLIHNPKKYLRILERLSPDADRTKNTIREHLIESEDEE